MSEPKLFADINKICPKHLPTKSPNYELMRSLAAGTRGWEDEEKEMIAELMNPGSKQFRNPAIQDAYFESERRTAEDEQLEAINALLPPGQEFSHLEYAIFHGYVRGWFGLDDDGPVPVGCWEWKGPIKHGYPSIKIDHLHQNPVHAMRIGWSAYNRVLLPDEKVIPMASCKNQLACVNPMHYELVPRMQNSKDPHTKLLNGRLKALRDSGTNLVLVTRRHAASISERTQKIIWEFVKPSEDMPPNYYLKSNGQAVQLRNGLIDPYIFKLVGGYRKRLESEPHWIPCLSGNLEALDGIKELDLWTLHESNNHFTLKGTTHDPDSKD